MSGPRRCHLDATPAAGDVVTPPEGEAHHLLHVLRQRPGDEVEWFDGRGAHGLARLVEAERRTCRLRIESLDIEPPPPVRLALYQAVPKLQKMDLILQRATEFGFSAVHAVHADRGEAKSDAEGFSRRLGRWRTVMIGAAKQCRRNRIPDLRGHPSVRAAVEARPAGERWLHASLSAEARPLKAELAALRAGAGGAAGSVAFWIGPEGDFSPAEYDLLRQAGARPVSLGPAVLRTETAADFVMAVLCYEWLSGTGHAADQWRDWPDR